MHRYVPKKNKEDIIESRANHIISSAINLIELINESYSAEEAELLEKRLISSIKGKDVKRFSRSISKLKGDQDEDC